MTWGVRFVRWLDQTGNFIANGDPDSTISARIGHHTRPEVKYPGRFWLWMRDIVDWAFYPWDGPGHCGGAYVYDRHERFRAVGWFSGPVMAVFVVLGCAAVVVINRLWLRWPALFLACWLWLPGLVDWLRVWLWGLA